jgi:hypothetical protein
MSALLAACLERIVRDRKAYARARERALIRLRKGLDLPWMPASSRDELHEQMNASRFHTERLFASPRDTLNP